MLTSCHECSEAILSFWHAVSPSFCPPVSTFLCLFLSLYIDPISHPHLSPNRKSYNRKNNARRGIGSKIYSMENEHAFMMEQFALVSMKQQERKQEIIDKMSEDSIVCAKLANCIKQVQYYQEELQHSKGTINQLEETIIKHKDMIIQLGEQLVSNQYKSLRHYLCQLLL